MSEKLRLYSQSGIDTSPYSIPKEINRPKEECGVFGIYLPHPDIRDQIVKVTLTGLLDNQHRGEESAGFAVGNGHDVTTPFTHMGLVRELHRAYEELPDKNKKEYQGDVAIAHTRYSTKGSSCIENAAPFLFDVPNQGAIAIAHNGSITNAQRLREELVKRGYQFKSTTDSEIIGALIANSEGETFENLIANSLKKLEGSFSLVMCTKDSLYGARDPIGNRPLSYAKFTVDGVEGYAVSSETPALEKISKVSYISDVKPGELLKFSKPPLEKQTYGASWTFTLPKKEAFCGLEIAYMLRPDSRVNGMQADTFRRTLGGELARLHPPSGQVDFVTYIPESAKSTAEGYAEMLSKLYDYPVFPRTGMLKGRYGTINGGIRGFIQPDTDLRENIAERNYRPFDWVKGKSIVLVDDSIVRGTTTSGVVDTLKNKVGTAAVSTSQSALTDYIETLHESGAKRIDLRILFPPVIGPCPLGTDINKQDKLIARDLGTTQKVAEYLKVDSLEHFSPAEYLRSVQAITRKTLCLGCTTLEYPVEIHETDKTIFEKTLVK